MIVATTTYCPRIEVQVIDGIAHLSLGHVAVPREGNVQVSSMAELFNVVGQYLDGVLRDATETRTTTVQGADVPG